MSQLQHGCVGTQGSSQAELIMTLNLRATHEMMYKSEVNGSCAAAGCGAAVQGDAHRL